VVGAQQADIHRAILEGSFDLGLVNYLEGDDRPPELETTTLLRGRAAVCMRPDSPLAARDAVRIADLRSVPLIGMRSGYLMHRYVHRLLADEIPRFSYTTDGAEMGKLMVAERLGVTVLPEFSLIGDPLELSGVITWRPLADDATEVQLAIQRLRSGSPARAAGEMYRVFRARARDYTDQRSGSVSTP
jgi:DNA-binding transcriptional LysR family regulator